MFDLLIRNAKVMDGSGEKPYEADIAVKGERIEKISPGIAADGRDVIDAGGFIVCPGFIDIHSHSDFTLLENPRAESKVRQGITTEVVGNCGFTAAPVEEAHFEDLMEYLVNTVAITDQVKEKWHWPAQHVFIEEIEQKGSAVNIVPLVGHGTIRVAAMGFEKHTPTIFEMDRMRKMLEDELAHGIHGMSTGLQYDPGSFAGTEELIELAKVLAEGGGIYTTHLKSEGSQLFECIDEAVEIAAASGVSVQVSHLKAINPANWGKPRKALNLMDDARQAGINIDFDVYPYTAFGSGLLDLLPPWSREAGAGKMVKLLKNSEDRDKMRHDMNSHDSGWENPMEGTSWEKVRIATVKTEKNRVYEGLNLKQVADAMGCTPEEAVFRLLAEEAGAVKMVFFGMCEDDVITIMKHPRAMFCTDGRAVAPYGDLGRDKVHPRYYGTYPRILGHYVRERRIMPLEEAVKKMTLLPARKMNLKDRGLIAPGCFADITVFDPDMVIDTATFDAPHSYPRGIEYVIVNGKIVVSKGEHTGNLPGKIIRRRG